MIEQHADNLIDAYALGALEPDEVAWVEAHLEGCPRCRELARAARGLAATLFFDVPLVEPPADLQQRVLARVQQEARQARPHAGADERERATNDSPGGEAPDAADRRRRGGLHRLLRGLLGEEPGAVTDAAAARLAELLSAPDCQVWLVAGTADAPGANARLVGVPGGHDAVLVASGLQPLPPDRAYQVWFLRGGQPAPNAVFHVARDGHGRQLVHAPGRLSDFEVVAVTPEPANGSPAPTGPIVLAGDLSR
jgi:anti-sigma-K factor RskA